MTITIEIGLELQAELARQAAAHGKGIDAYVASLLEEAARPAASETQVVPVPEGRRRSDRAAKEPLERPMDSRSAA